MANLPAGYQYTLTPCNKFARGLPTTYGSFTRGLPQLHIKGQPLCNTSEENIIQSYNQEVINSYKTTTSPSQSRETVPLSSK
jgi:hypothetical protein